MLESHTESHHITPRCMGGTDDITNLVDLTPEEHYTAHQLLVRIYPENRKLMYAAVMMTVKGKNNNRSKNKLYGWLKRKLSESARIRQSGKGNSQFDTVWIYNVISGISRKIKLNELSLYLGCGWIKGRNLKKKICVICDKEFITGKLSKHVCSKECSHQIRSQKAQDHPFSRSVISDDGNIFRSLSATARYYGIDVETVRYRIKKEKYRWAE